MADMTEGSKKEGANESVRKEGATGPSDRGRNDLAKTRKPQPNETKEGRTARMRKERPRGHQTGTAQPNKEGKTQQEWGRSDQAKQIRKERLC